MINVNGKQYNVAKYHGQNYDKDQWVLVLVTLKNSCELWLTPIKEDVQIGILHDYLNSQNIQWVKTEIITPEKSTTVMNPELKEVSFEYVQNNDGYYIYGEHTPYPTLISIKGTVLYYSSYTNRLELADDSWQNIKFIKTNKKIQITFV